MQTQTLSRFKHDKYTSIAKIFYQKLQGKFIDGLKMIANSSKNGLVIGKMSGCRQQDNRRKRRQNIVK